MKFTPFQVFLQTLTGGKGRITSMSTEEAIARLKRMSGEDFGTDAAAWRAWAKEHPEISGVYSPRSSNACTDE